ncbi:MAG TPA: NADH-quinone oxidoreductase subunit L [Bacteroidales bacterium]|nr:NADH-quinone oxidoreductase subunit L [Bacteroidales bacterium]
MQIADYIWLVPALPILSFILISIFGKKLHWRLTAILGLGSVSISAIIAIIAGISYLSAPPETGSVTSHIYTWLKTGNFKADVNLLLDPLSLVFCFIITFVGALIHMYSVEFMRGDDGFNRFFAYMNLFVGSMLILVLADNLLLLYLGWEGVGLCSYLLIGFWYREPANVAAANKAFTVTRIGDTFMIIGLFLLLTAFGTLNIQDIMKQAPEKWVAGSPVAVAAALLLLGGALGKSAQLPLQTWLPDAMAGPSPVSALIHAATMVTAGVYLVTRTHVLFTLAPAVMKLIAVIGALTLLIAGFSALAQTDLKRILAYSTISQIGYMFVAMGIGAWSASIFHFMTHAFFKALLFLAGGAVIHLLHDEHDIFRMGGLRKKMPLVFITFLIGAASLAALPLITAGFYSKDEIIWFEFAAEKGNSLLWLAGITGSLLTSLYIFRLVFIVFFGETKTGHVHEAGFHMKVPLVVLAILSVVGGFIELPRNLGPVHLFSGLFGNSLPNVSLSKDESSEIIIQVISAVISVGGIFLAWKLFAGERTATSRVNESRIMKFFRRGWGFDTLYDTLLVRPYRWLSGINKHDFINSFNYGIENTAIFFSSLFTLAQNGKIRWYVLFLTLGVVVILAFMIAL